MRMKVTRRVNIRQNRQVLLERLQEAAPQIERQINRIFAEQNEQGHRNPDIYDIVRGQGNQLRYEFNDLLQIYNNVREIRHRP